MKFIIIVYYLWYIYFVLVKGGDTTRNIITQNVCICEVSDPPSL